MSYAHLLGIVLKHSYYGNGLCGDFSLAPSADSERLLRNHRCVLKTRASGSDIYVEVGDDGRPRIPFGDGSTISFELRLRNPEFSLFTDPAALAGGEGYEIVYPDPAKQESFFARIDIHRDFNQVDGKISELLFSARSMFWIYYLVTDQTDSGTGFSISARDDPALTWKQAEGTDHFSRRLAGQYPGLRQLRFASEQMLPCREFGLRNVQLFLGGNAIVESLPSPSWRNYLQAEIGEQGARVDAVFHVLKYLTNTTLTKV